MNIAELKEIAYAQNMNLYNAGLALYTWGNASAVDRDRGVMAIKPSGVPYETMRPDDMVLVRLKDGRAVEGRLKPSSDTATHRALYLAFGEIGGVAHTHSTNATAWAQFGRGLPALGTTHADHFYGEVPCTREMHPKEIENDYEWNTGLVIAETFDNIDPLHVPAVLVKGHGPFTWGETAEKAVMNASVLEQCCRMALLSAAAGHKLTPISQELLDKHFLRKHGEKAYYGQ